MRESLSNVSNFLIYIYWERKASKINNSYFISLDARKCEEEDVEFDVYIKIHFKATKRFHMQYSHLSSYHLAGVQKNRLHQGQSSQTNSSETAFKTDISQLKTNLIERGYAG